MTHFSSISGLPISPSFVYMGGWHLVTPWG